MQNLDWITRVTQAFGCLSWKCCNLERWSQKGPSPQTKHFNDGRCCASACCTSSSSPANFALHWSHLWDWKNWGVTRTDSLKVSGFSTSELLWLFPLWIFRPFSDLKIFSHWSHFTELDITTADSYSFSEDACSDSKEAAFLLRNSSFCFFVLLKGWASSQPSHQPSWVPKRQSLFWCPERWWSWSQQRGKSWRFAPWRPTSGKIPDIGSQEQSCPLCLPFLLFHLNYEKETGSMILECFNCHSDSHRMLSRLS